jgi:hypothetical protein
MAREGGRNPLLQGRGTVLVDVFARGAGVSPASVAELVETGRLEGLVDENGNAHSLFDDALPTGERLRAMGLATHPDYSPEDFASVEVDDTDGEDDADQGPTSTITW